MPKERDSRNGWTSPDQGRKRFPSGSGMRELRTQERVRQDHDRGALPGPDVSNYNRPDAFFDARGL